MPLLFSKSDFQRALELIPVSVDATRKSKFRENGNVALEYFIPHVAFHEGKAVMMELGESLRQAAYVPLLDFWPATLWYLAKARMHRSKWINLNDGLGPSPSRITNFLARRFLNRHYPRPSLFERAA